MITTKTKYDANLVKAANSEAKTLEGNKKGVSQLDITGARRLLASLGDMAPKHSGQKGALTKAINHLAKAISDAKVDPNARGLPTHPLNPPFLGGPGPAGPTAPVPTKVTAKRTHELQAAFQMMDSSKIKWKEGSLDHVAGAGYAKVSLEDHRPTDGNAIFAFIPTGPVLAPNLMKKHDPNKETTFFLQSYPGRGGKEMMAGPFDVPAGIEAAPKVMEKAYAIGEKIAEQKGHRLSKSDAVHLRGIKPLANGKYEAKLDVSFWMDASKVHAHITAVVDQNGKVFSGDYKSVRKSDD